MIKFLLVIANITILFYACQFSFRLGQLDRNFDWTDCYYETSKNATKTELYKCVLTNYPLYKVQR